MTQLGVGTATFSPAYGLAGETPAPAEATALLRDAFAAGIRYVDTAAGYGTAEAVVGQVADAIRDHGVRVCTKASADAARSRGLIAAVQESLARLKLDAVDTLLLHSAGGAVLTDAALQAELAHVRARKLAVRTGASTYGAADAQTALAQPWCGALQVEHSILNPTVVAAIGEQPHGAEIVARSVLCKGLLSSRRRHAGEFAGVLEPVLDALERLAAEWGWTLPEVAIRYALDTPGVDVVVVGVSTEDELETALSAAARAPMGSEARAMLARFDVSAHDAAHPERWPASLQGA